MRNGTNLEGRVMALDSGICFWRGHDDIYNSACSCKVSLVQNRRL